MMSAKDVIKSRVYESMGGGTGIDFLGIFLILIMACLIGIYIFWIYKNNSKAAFYSKDFNVTMAGLVVVIAAIMIAMQSNLIVSLGMVGALSIVRFRNAVKNPIDLLYIFWAVSAGIIVGVRLELLAIVLCAVMTVLLLILESIPASKASSLLIIRIRQPEFDWDNFKKIISTYARYYKEKSKNIRKEETEVIIELKCSKSDELLEELRKIEAIDQISYLEYDGEYRG